MTLLAPPPTTLASPGPLPSTLLGWHVLGLLRTLTRYRSSDLVPRHGAPTGVQAQADMLRALGYALASRHERTWAGLLQHSRVRWRSFLGTQRPLPEFVYGHTLGLAAHLRHTPVDLRLAPVGLGQALITAAVGLEHLLALDSTSEVPGPPTLTHPPLSPRDGRMLEVTAALAALELAPSLSPGHRTTVHDLLLLAQTLRGALVEEARAHRWALGWVLRESRDALNTRRVAGDPSGIDTLRACVQATVASAGDKLHLVLQEGSVMLALEAVAAHLSLPKS